jgi:hypothetical protein
MSAIKPTQFTYKSYTGAMITQAFKCESCGSESCYRHKSDYGLTYFEGHFHCVGCKKEANYYTDDWQRAERKRTKQLSLF